MLRLFSALVIAFKLILLCLKTMLLKFIYSNAEMLISSINALDEVSSNRIAWNGTISRTSNDWIKIIAFT